MSSSTPDKTRDDMLKALEARESILLGGDGDYRFTPTGATDDAETAVAEARAVLDKIMNGGENAMTEIMTEYKTANGILAAARDHKIMDFDRLTGVLGYLNDLEVDLNENVTGTALPGVDAKE